MKIFASIPVEKIRLSPVTFTFRHEVRMVDVVRVIRWAGPNNRRLGRFHYQADIKQHPDMCAEAICCGPRGVYRTNIVRKALNPKWKPPKFLDGNDVFEVSE